MHIIIMFFTFFKRQTVCFGTVVLWLALSSCNEKHLLQREADRRLAADKLLSMIDVASGFTHDVTPMLLDTTRTFFQYEKL